MINNLVLIEPEKLTVLIENSVRKVLNEKQHNEYDRKLFSLNRAAKEIGIHYDTLKKYIDSDYIKTSSDGKHITGVEIRNYLNTKNAVS